MKPKTIAQVPAMMFDGHLIICLDGKWVNNVFRKIPTFQVTIDKRRLQITSEDIPIGDEK